MRMCSPVLARLVLVFMALASGRSDCTASEIPDEPNTDKPILALDTGGHTNAVYKLMVSRYLKQRVRELSGGKQVPIIERPRGVRSFPLAKPQTAPPPARPTKPGGTNSLRIGARPPLAGVRCRLSLALLFPGYDP